MRILRVKALAGPNVWANFSCLEVRVDLEELRDTSSEMIPGFNDRLTSWLPTLIEHRCSIGERGGFFERLRRGTYPAHILEHVTLELQTLAGTEVGFGRAREMSTEGVYRVAIEYQEEAVARAALKTAFRLLLAAIANSPFDVAAEVARLREVADSVKLGPSTQAIVSAAVRRGIPVRRLTSGSLVRFGHGIRQRRILAAETDSTGAIAESIAQDKDLTRQLLREAGIPVPTGGPVDSADAACELAASIGGPVVVKPRFGNQGRGVATNLTTPDEVRAAYAAAREEGSAIVVEQFIPGDDYRLLVVGRKLVAAARRDPACVIGDGERSVRELINIVNRDPRRGDGHESPLTRLKLDAISISVLAQQGLTTESVPEAGRLVLIRRNANLSTGGTAVDVTDEVHPAVAARAVEAARIIGLDVTGIDVVARDIRQPLDAANGAIIELNAAPGLRMHLSPSSGSSRPVGDAIVDLMFPDGQTGRIPLVAVTGVNGKTTVTRLTAHILRGSGRTVGMTCTDGIWIGSRQIDTDDCSGPLSAQAVLAHPDVEAAVLETARGGILRAGLGFDRCDVAIVTNLGSGDHLGLDGIETLEQLAAVKRVVVDVVPPTGTAVLNAADPLVLGMAEKCNGRVLLFAIDPLLPALAGHRASGGAVAFVRDDSILVAEGSTELVVAPLDRIPLTWHGRLPFQVENVLAAVAAAWSLGVGVEQIRDAVSSFAASFEQSPGRFNVLETGGATIVVDYGHNVSSLEAVIKALEALPGQRHVAVYSTAGDRRNEDIIRQGELLGDHFDRVIVYEGQYKRGRSDGETTSLFREGLRRGRRVQEIIPIDGALPALAAGLDGLQSGDVLLLQADQVDETVAFLHDRLGTSAKPSSVTATAAAAGSETVTTEPLALVAVV